MVTGDTLNKEDVLMITKLTFENLVLEETTFP